MTQTTVTIKAKDKTKKAFASVNGSLKKMSGLLFNAKSAVAGLVGVGGLGALVVSSSKAADSLAKTADKLGLTTEALGGLRHAAELSGVGANTMDMALQRMTRRLSEAAKGTGEAKKAIEELGLNAQQLSAMAPDQAFLRITKAMEGAGTQADRVRLAMRFFDSEGVALVNTMQLGEDGIIAATEAAKAYGTALSRADASKIERANGAMVKIQSVVKGIGTTIAVNLAPYIEVVAEKLAQSSKESNGFKKSIMNAIESTIRGLGVLADAIHYLNIAWQAVKLGAVALFDYLMQNFAHLDRTISHVIDIIPGLSASPSQDIQLWANASALAVNDVAKGLDEVLTAERPSDALIETLNNIKVKAEEVSQAVVAAKAAGAHGEDEQAMLDAEFEAMSEHTDRILRLYEMEEDAMNKKAKLEAQLAKDKLAVAKGITGNMATLMASSSKKEFEIGKKFALANALVKGYEAVTGAYSAGAKIGGPPLGAAYAGAAAIATKVQIDNIRKQSFGGGGGVSVSGGAGGGISTGANLGGGAPAQASPDQQAIPRQEVNITLTGDNYSDEQVRDLIERINEQTGDGVELKANKV